MISDQARFLDTAHSHVTLRGEPLLWSVLKLSCTRCGTCLQTLPNRREKKQFTAPRCTVPTSLELYLLLLTLWYRVYAPNSLCTKSYQGNLTCDLSIMIRIILLVPLWAARCLSLHRSQHCTSRLADNAVQTGRAWNTDTSGTPSSWIGKPGCIPV